MSPYSGQPSVSDVDPASLRPAGDGKLDLLPARPERRRGERRAADFPVRIEHRSGRGLRRQDGRAVDIGERGMLLDLPGPLPSTDSLTAEFWIPPRTFSDRHVHRLRLRGRVTRSSPRPAPAGAHRVALEFDTGLDQALSRAAWRTLSALGGILLALTVAAILVLKAWNIENYRHAPILCIYSLGVTAYVLSRFIIAAFYRSPPDVGHRPSVSVIVAAKNEEKAIAETLERVFESRYPADRLEVIAIDDGSSDGTFREMERVRRLHPQLRLIRFSQNRGKRHGMAAGARASSGEILVFVDSDSFMERDAIHHLVQGFADPAVAAVAAHGFVANAWKNQLTRMQAVQYYLAFRVLKAAESVFSSVTCCSGCCSAYRRSAVMDVLQVWLDQTFLGRPATFGDDRSLTNYMLREHKVIYDSSAHVSTIVPENYRQFFRQQLRWKKSWLRENMVAASFMWKKQPLMVISFFAGFIFPILAPLVVFRALVYLPVFAGRLSLTYLFGVFLMSVLYSVYYLMRQRNRMWIHGLFLCVLYTLVLTWQLPWAMLTSWNNKWGTR